MAGKPTSLVRARQAEARELARQLHDQERNWVEREFAGIVRYLTQGDKTEAEAKAREKLQATFDEGLDRTVDLLSKKSKISSEGDIFTAEDAVNSTYSKIKESLRSM